MCQHCLNFFQFVQAFKTIFLTKGQEGSYLFVSLEKLAEDFYRDVEQIKKEITPSVSYDKILFEIAVS